MAIKFKMTSFHIFNGTTTNIFATKTNNHDAKNRLTTTQSP